MHSSCSIPRERPLTIDELPGEIDALAIGMAEEVIVTDAAEQLASIIKPSPTMTVTIHLTPIPKKKGKSYEPKTPPPRKQTNASQQKAPLVHQTLKNHTKYPEFIKHKSLKDDCAP
jgi:hypothetical protein